MTISIDDDVTLLGEQITALQALDAKASPGENEVYDLSIRWGTALAGRLPRLLHYSTRHLLSDADEQRFRALCAELRAVSPLAERHGLARPILPGPPAGAVGRQ